jgi:5-enolpyruvylshikimate-3-phosphate synthase
MSERAIAFVEEFVSENVHAEGYEPEGDHSQAAAFAAQCLASAKAEGITDAEMKNAFEDLTQFMAAAIKTANDDEVDRLASKDDSF